MTVTREDALRHVAEFGLAMRRGESVYLRGRSITAEELDVVLTLAANSQWLRERIAKQIEDTPHPCNEPDGAYCACADLQRKQDAEIARTGTHG